MKKEWKIVVSIIMMIIGIIFFLKLTIRFFNQGYFGGGSRALYLILLEMKDWFGTIIYSFLFALSGFLLLKKEETCALMICQFIVIDRIWYIYEKIGNWDVSQSLESMVLALFILLFLILERNGGYRGTLIKLGIIILLNLAIIAVGKFILPPLGASL